MDDLIGPFIFMMVIISNLSMFAFGYSMGRDKKDNEPCDHCWGESKPAGSSVGVVNQTSKTCHRCGDMEIQGEIKG